MTSSYQRHSNHRRGPEHVPSHPHLALSSSLSFGIYMSPLLSTPGPEFIPFNRLQDIQVVFLKQSTRQRCQYQSMVCYGIFHPCEGTWEEPECRCTCVISNVNQLTTLVHTCRAARAAGLTSMRRLPKLQNATTEGASGSCLQHSSQSLYPTHSKPKPLKPRGEGVGIEGKGGGGRKIAEDMTQDLGVNPKQPSPSPMYL